MSSWYAPPVNVLHYDCVSALRQRVLNIASCYSQFVRVIASVCLCAGELMDPCSRCIPSVWSGGGRRLLTVRYVTNDAPAMKSQAGCRPRMQRQASRVISFETIFALYFFFSNFNTILLFSSLASRPVIVKQTLYSSSSECIYRKSYTSDSCYSS